MLGFKIKNTIINLDIVKDIELGERKISFNYRDDFTTRFEFDNEREAEQLFEKIERLTCENKIQ